MTLGQLRVRVAFNPSGNRYVDRIKADAASMIDYIENNLKVKEPRLAALAQTAIEEGAMWAVKAATADAAP